jgi:hypothetical protein
VRCYDTLELQASVLARLCRPSAAALGAIDRLIAFVRQRFPVALAGAVIEQIRATLVYWAVRLPILEGSYARMFDQLRPRVVFLEGGSYGTFAHVCRWARRDGIATAELQHGNISRAHLAYNFGDAVCQADALAACLPRHLLLYGELWGSEVRSPSELVVVGCPHFSENAPRAPRSHGATVLTISQGICTDVMVRHTAALARALPDRRFVFRPHPGEVAFRERYAQLGEIPNVEINDAGDVYQRFREAAAVIGHSSTALFEAAGLGIPVFIVDDQTSRSLLPSSLGARFSTFDELLDLVRSPPRAVVDPERFFVSDWRDRYRDFIARVAS